MKKILVTLLILFSFITTYGQGKGFLVKGHITGVKDGHISVIYTGPNNDQHKVDTIMIKNHKFVYKGVAKETKFVYMLVGNLEEKVRSYGFPMFLENKSITVTTDIKNLEDAIIKGSPLNDSYNRLLANTDLFKHLRKNETQLRIAGEKKNNEEIEKLKNEQKKIINSILAYLESQPKFDDNLAVAYLIYDRIGMYLKGDHLLSVLNKFSPEINKSVYFSFLRRELSMEKTLSIGNPAPEFALPDLDGKIHSLKDYRGQYVLIDFGASWCHWCKKEKPFLLNVHNKYKGKGLTIINISMDKKKADWEKDIKKENYPWISISDLKAWAGDIAKHYNVKGIPNIMLIDRQGKIVAKGLRGVEIEKEIEKHLKKEQTENGFEINGRIRGLQKGKVYLFLNASKTRKLIDSALVINERFSLKGKTSEPMVYDLRVPDVYFKGIDSYSPSASIFIENSNISFDAKLDSLDYATVKGSAIHDEYVNFLNTAEPLAAMKELVKKAHLAYENKEYDASQDYFRQRDRILYKQYPEFLMNNVANYSDSKVFAYIFYKEMGMADWKARENAIKNFNGDLQNNFYVKHIKADIEKYKSIAVGTQAPNFSLPDVNGKKVQLSDFRGKYVLVDFWASWCGPCREETPNVKAVYEKYKHKGFEVIGISLDKKNQEKEWRKAITDDQADWVQLSSLTGGDCVAAQQYNVKGIPHCVLIDKKGTIIAKDLRGKDFEKELSKIFSDNNK